MRTLERAPALIGQYRDELIQPALVLTSVACTAVQWPDAQIAYRPLALPLFVLTSIAALASLLPWSRLAGNRQIAVMSAYMLFGAVLMPLAHATFAAMFPFVAASAAGIKLASRRAAVTIATAGAVVASSATWVVGELSPQLLEWPVWLTLTVALPVAFGIGHRDRRDAIRNAQLAAESAQRARESEAREAALVERGRIAREIHDVLGHSLSGIALQLDLADALRDSGRDDEAAAAVRKARAIAVDSINETRRAVHALREDTLPLPETLYQLAEHASAEFAIEGEAGAVGPETTHTMVRAAQEAMTNAAKYAPGAPRSLRLAFTADHVKLTVHNGPATEPRRAELAGGSGVGLVGMRERAALLGGTLRAGPADDGWTVELELPR
ncbi:signal transduction histidine kinase [Amycolatopsis echigonensis]|uniref:histidine kinase n=1 Tax=Amycolatopsis echigonensis TaxID=2576905 RepID=A0A2N3WC15_9PSEU|nr:histidine kinase [Amycolatopsis niigatensis]PKV91415.1 signal transduction histidine kinase [Amycolatopsis niigatensis]